MFLAPILIICWIPFGINFHYISWLSENSCFATGIMWNTCFAHQGLPFWHPKSMQKTCFFKTPTWTPFLMILCWLYAKMVDLGTLKNPVGAKIRPQSTSGAKSSKKNTGAAQIVGSWNRPFSRIDSDWSFHDFCRFMIGLGQLFCNFVKIIDGVAVVLGTLFKKQ